MKNIEGLMSYKDIIEILVNNNILHREFILNRIEKREIKGLYDPDENKIFINTKQNLIDKRKVIIHELLHAKYFLEGKKDTEKQVNKETSQIYNFLYNTE